MSSLEDLLDHGSEPDRPQSGRRRTVWLLGMVPLLAAALAGVVTLVAYSAGYLLWFPVVFTGLLALLALHRAVKGLRTVNLVDRQADDAPEVPDIDGLGRAVQPWQARLVRERSGRWRADRSLQPRLAELVDERLRQRRGLSRTGDPVHAHQVLGDRLWAYLSDRRPRGARSRELAALLDDVERI